MHELRELLAPEWGAEKWILEGWAALTQEEKKLVRARMDDMFRDGLPFTLVHNHIDYIRVFSLLAQLEVLAIQIPLKFASINATPALHCQMREQLVDEVFHGLVFTKISFMLSAPYASPPPYNSAVEELCNFVRNESCSKTAVILLNLIAEGWIEEFFDMLMQQQIAPKVFDVILADERRHVEDADLYCSLGLPPLKELKEKINHIEDLLLTKILADYRHISILSVFSIDKRMFLQSLHEKHVQQLEKIKAQPGKRWRSFMHLMLHQLPHLVGKGPFSEPVEMSDTRKMLMTQWKNPGDPTMVGDFELDITCLDYFSLKKPHAHLTLCLLQTISKAIESKKNFRLFLFHNQLRQATCAVVALVVRLPKCNGALGYVVLKDCHLLTLKDLEARIQYATAVQVYCFKRRQALERRYPHLRQKLDTLYYEMMNGVYPVPLPSNAMVSVSNLDVFGFTGGKSPLRPNEALKFTLLKADRKLVWSQDEQTFLPRDMLPISVSADHRVFDANIRLPQQIKSNFAKIHAKNQLDERLNLPPSIYDPTEIIAYIEHFSQTDVELVHATLSFFSSIWLDEMTYPRHELTNVVKNMIAGAFELA